LTPIRNKTGYSA